MAHQITIKTCTNDEYHAELQHDGDELPYEINIERTKFDDTFYIKVLSPSGLMAYDGYWTGEPGATMDDAVAEALVGGGVTEYPAITLDSVIGRFKDEYEEAGKHLEKMLVLENMTKEELVKAALLEQVGFWAAYKDIDGGSEEVDE